jgi:ABC-2 type transport system ATP-binding protein
MIKVDKISKRFGSIVAVDGISFEVRAGEVLGFLGPNGAGKSTTMKILTCFLPPDSGTAQVAGCDIRTDPVGVRARIGYVPENAPLYDDLTVDAFLRFIGDSARCRASCTSGSRPCRRATGAASASHRPCCTTRRP